MNLKFFLLKIVLLVLILPTPLLSQWIPTGANTVPANHRAWSLKIAPDRTVWSVITLDAFPPTGGIPKVIRSTDEGATWETSEIPEGQSSYGWDIAPIDSLNAFVTLDPAGLFQTTDGGLSWNRVDTFKHVPLFAHFFNENEGWIGARDTSNNELVNCVTTNGGQSWIYIAEHLGFPPGTSAPLNPGPTDQPTFTFSINSAYDIYENTIVVGRTAGNYWRSDDKGYNWTNFVTPLDNVSRTLSNITLKDENTIMVASDILQGSFNGASAFNYTSFDGGQTWPIAGESGMIAAMTRYIPNSDSVFIMVGHNNFGWGEEGTAISYDYGATWEKISGTSLITIDFLDENFGMGTCCNNAWPTANGQISKWDFDLPTSTVDLQEVSAIQIAPNPVEDFLLLTTKESLGAGELTIEVIAANGQVVQRDFVSGDSQYEIDTSQLPKGIYGVRLIAENYSFSELFVKN